MAETTSGGRTGLHAAFWVIAERWGTRVISLVGFVVLSRIIGPTAFGLMAMAMAYVEFARLVVDQGIGDAITSRHERDSRVLATAFWVSFMLGILLASASFAAAPLVGLLFGEDRVVDLVRAMSVFFIIQGSCGVHEAILQRDLEFRTLAVRRLLAAAIGTTTAIGLALGGAGAWSLVWQALVSAAVGAIFLWSRVRFRPGFVISGSALTSLLRFGAKSAVVNLLSYLNSYGDNLIVGLVLGPTQLGIYTVSFRILILLNDLFAGALSTVSGPVFGRIRQDHPAIRATLTKLTTVSAGIGLPLYVLAFFSAPLLIPWLFGRQWEPAIDIMQWLIVGMALWTVNLFDRSILYATDHVGYELVIVAIAAVRTVVAASIGAMFSLEAVAMCIGLAMYLTWPVRIYFLRRSIDLDVAAYLTNLAQVGSSVLLAAGLAYLATIPAEGVLASVGLSCGAFLLAYVALVRVIAPQLTHVLGSTFRARPPRMRG